MDTLKLLMLMMVINSKLSLGVDTAPLVHFNFASGSKNGRHTQAFFQI